MNRYLIVTLLAIAATAFAQSTGPVASVSSRAEFSVQGTMVPEGSTRTPVMAGDVIRTGSAPAELRMRDGSSVYVPAASKYVVGQPESKTAATRGVLRILEGGAVAFQAAASRSGVTGPTANDASTTQSLAQVLAIYGGVASPLVEAIDEAIAVQGTVTVRSAGNTYTITGAFVKVGNGTLTPATFIVSPNGIQIVPAGGGAPLATFAPPPPGGPPAGCAGITSPPKDVTPVVVNIPGVC
jgi:hypothetical protein